VPFLFPLSSFLHPTIRTFLAPAFEDRGASGRREDAGEKRRKMGERRKRRRRRAFMYRHI
jgi:hypothetical protein